MSVLTLERVSKTYRRAGRSFTALEDVSFTVEAGEHVSVWGGRRSGRTTLLRVAAGLEEADSGTVRPAEDAGCGFVQASALPTRELAVDYVAFPLLARGVGAAEAHEQAQTQLATVGASSCAGLRAGELDAADRVRVGLAQILVRRPRLVLADEPTGAVDLLEREPLMALLRRVADSGVAVLMTTAEAIGVAGVDRVLTIADGRVRTGIVREPATVIPLRRSAGSR
jgi:ABC-type lipoprotein export system ATPase subunit